MAHDLAQLIRRNGARLPAQASTICAVPSSGILDPSVARRLGKPVPKRVPWVSERDALDALMTFALTFTGAMVFLF